MKTTTKINSINKTNLTNLIDKTRDGTSIVDEVEILYLEQYVARDDRRFSCPACMPENTFSETEFVLHKITKD